MVRLYFVNPQPYPFISLFIHSLLLSTLSKVFITPRSYDKGKPYLFQSSNHEQMFVTHTWEAWTSSNECSDLSYAWDPWSCHFLSLSKCNNQALHYATKSEVNMTAEPLPDHSIYDQQIKNILRSRLACNDGERLVTSLSHYHLITSLSPHTSLSI